MLTITEIAKSAFYRLGMLIIAGACTCIGIFIVGLILCIFGG